jgi:trigger factor
MSSTIKKLSKGEVEVAVTVDVADIEKDLEHAAHHLSEAKPIDGFRPGKAPYAQVKARFGEAAILEAALDDIVRRTYVAAVKEHDLHTFGEPSVSVTKLAPGNPVEYVAIVTLVPKVLKLADPRKLTVDEYPTDVEDSDVEGTLKELQKMQTKEVVVDRASTAKDKVVLDMDMSKANVPLDGGQARDHGVYMDQEAYIPGLKEQLLGLKKGDKKKFALSFPKDHYQKHLAGTDVDFDVTIKDVFELQHPELNDEFAKTLGKDSIADLKQLLTDNIGKDKKNKEQERLDVAMLEKLADGSKFEEIPEKILNIEVNRMLAEYKHSINEKGLEFEDFLMSLKKTVDDLRVEFAVQAAKRVKTALIMRELAETEHIEVTDVELLEETNTMMNSYSHDAKLQERLRSEEYQDYLRTSIRNRKVMDFLRDAVTTKLTNRPKK